MRKLNFFFNLKVAQNSSVCVVQATKRELIFLKYWRCRNKFLGDTVSFLKAKVGQ